MKGTPRKRFLRTAGTAAAALAAFALIGGAVYFGVNALSGIGLFPRSTTAASATDPSAIGTSASTEAATRPGSAGVSDSQLIQRLIDMILSDAQFDEMYGEIPESQRPGVDPDTFYQYVSLLRRGIRGKITAYVAMEEDEIVSVREEILSNSPRYRYLVEVMSGYWILYQTTDGSQERFAVYLHRQEDGQYVFSKDWIDGALSIQSYATLYFDAVEKSNADALSVLVHSEINDAGIRAGKAAAIIRFYQKCVTVKSSAFRLLYARADSFGYEQSGIDYTPYMYYRPYVEEGPNPTATPDESGSGSAPSSTPTPLPTPESGDVRQVRIVKAGLDQIKIEDPIPFDLSRGDVTVYVDHEPALTLGEYVYSFELNTRFGTRISYDSLPALDPFDSGLRIIRAHYPDVTVMLIGSDDERLQAFQGHVFSIELHSGNVESGYGLSVGATRKTVLARFPFADLDGWTIQSPGSYDRIDFTIREGVIAGIRISRQLDDLEDAVQRAARITPVPATGDPGGSP